MAQGDRAKLFEFYKMAFPFYRAQNPKANGKGLYFERLMMYGRGPCDGRSEEHTSELQSLMRISYAVFCLKKKKNHNKTNIVTNTHIHPNTINNNTTQ